MNRHQRARLAAVSQSLPSHDDLDAQAHSRAELEAYGRAKAGTATAADFTLLCDTTMNRQRLLERAGVDRYRLTRGLPMEPGPWTSAALVVSWPLDEDPPRALYEQLQAAASPVDPNLRGGDEWADANGLLAILGPDRGATLRHEYYRHLERYDPLWLALRPEGGSPPAMVQRVEDGTADLRDHFHCHLPYLRLYRNEFMVAAVGHRFAREGGASLYLTEPRHLAAELVSYPPGQDPPGDLWAEIEIGARRHPTAAWIKDWREFNRCLVVLRHGNVDRCRQFLDENWELYEAEHRYLTGDSEPP